MFQGDFILKRLVYSLLGSALIIVAFWLGATPAKAQFAYLPTLQNGHLPLCRLGINGHLGSYPLRPLRLGWYLDYTASAASRPVENLHYFPMVRLQQTGADSYTYSLAVGANPLSESQLRSIVALRPGTYWFIGNEPDRKVYQDDIEPHVYARAYHDLYQIIKDQDPTAKIVAGAIVQPTDIRIQYLNLVVDSYSQSYQQAMPVDAWAFHNFILNEADCDFHEDCWGAGIPPGVSATEGLRIDVQDNDNLDLFKEQVYRFRQWMADHGYRNTPAFLSEFGVLMPQGLFNPDFTVERVNNFMNATFDYLLNATDPNLGFPGDENRLVQRFAWYSVDDNINHNGFLFNRNQSPQSARTGMGDNFVSYANAIGDTVDYFPVELKVVSAPPTIGGITTVTFAAKIGNSGNLGVGTSATVRFFNGNPNSGGVEIGSAPISLQGCGERGTVNLAWESVTPGNYEVFAQVTTVVSGVEVNQSNNLLSVSVTVN